MGRVTDALGLTDTGAAKDLASQSQAASRQVLERLDKVNLPDIEKMMLALEYPELVGELTAETLGPSELGEVKFDPRMREEQQMALEALSQRGREGMTDEDRIIYREFMDQAGAEEQAKRANIMADMDRRGMADSGTSLAAQLSAGQGAAQAKAQQGAQMARASLEAKRNALAQSGQMAGQMGQQQFEQDSQAARAKDVIGQFNLSNRQNIAQANLAQKQRVAEGAQGIRNQQQMFNKQLNQQQFENEMRKAGAAGTALSNQSAALAQMAGQQSAANQAVIGGLIQGGAAAFGASDKDVKKDIKEPSNKEIGQNLQKLLDSIEPYLYKYKDAKKHGKGDKGEFLGVMAQDLEKSEIGKESVFEDADGVKNVDYAKLMGAQLAATKNVLSRIEALEKKLKG